MGLYTMSDSREPRLGEPQPHDFDIEKIEQVGANVVALVRYPHASEFGGLKVLVYRNRSVNEIVTAKLLDPHFLENEGALTPFARFEASKEGFQVAAQLAAILQ